MLVCGFGVALVGQGFNPTVSGSVFECVDVLQFMFGLVVVLCCVQLYGVGFGYE